jgi:hypothetical protein
LARGPWREGRSRFFEHGELRTGPIPLEAAATSTRWFAFERETNAVRLTVSVVFIP